MHGERRAKTWKKIVESNLAFNTGDRWVRGDGWPCEIFFRRATDVKLCIIQFNKIGLSI